MSVGLTNLTMSDYRAFAKCKVDRPAVRGVSIPFLGTNDHKYIATYYVKNHRRKVISAGTDWMCLAVMGAQRT